MTKRAATKRAMAACLLPLLLVGAVGCSTSADGEDVASVNGSAAPSVTPSLDTVEQGRRHAQCLREHGIPASDPQVQPNGTVRFGGGFDKGSVDAEALARAIQACRRYEPVLSGGDRDRKTAGAIEYARCMRANGVADFPDPDANGEIQLPPEQTDPDYDQAEATCRAQVREPSPSPGATR
ncbi:hypothetical protein [Micromonospora sp. NPDC007230]|uniref:hypothetical protein n=1 Tax=Micromonospora sp. NPDC007230 TaxID=3364237 RepID=UPI0036B4EFEF